MLKHFISKLRFARPPTPVTHSDNSTPSLASVARGSHSSKRPKLHPSWCFYAAVWGIIAGLITSLAFELNFSPNIFLIILLLAVIIFSFLYPSRLMLCAVFLAGVLLGGFRVSPHLTGKDTISQFYGQSVTISGTLSEDPDTSKNPVAIRLKNLKISTSSESSETVSVDGILYITLSTDANLERSDYVTLSGKLESGFGTFVGKISRAKVLAIERSDPGDIFARFKHWFADRVRESIPSPEVDLGLGYLMGMKTGLSEDFSEALRAVGMTHVVVASGAHLAILISAAKKLFGRISKFAGTLFALLLIFAFAMIVGFTPSMTRAALVASLSLLVGYVGRRFTPLRLIGFVGMLTLLIDPMNYLNLGWQLSFASFFGILVFAPLLQTFLYGGKRPPWLASMLITSLATSLICAPILVYNFGSLSLLSFVANLIILPTLPYAMFLMMLTGTLSLCAPLAAFTAWITRLLLDLHIWLINFLSDKTIFIIEAASGNSLIFLLYLPVLLFILFVVYLHHENHLRSRNDESRPLRREAADSSDSV